MNLSSLFGTVFYTGQKHFTKVTIVKKRKYTSTILPRQTENKLQANGLHLIFFLNLVIEGIIDIQH